MTSTAPPAVESTPSNKKMIWIIGKVIPRIRIPFNDPIIATELVAVLIGEVRLPCMVIGHR